MANINKNIIMQAGAAVTNATNKAAGLSASTPEPGSIISAIQLVNGGRTVGPDALAHFTESVRNKLLSLLVSMEPIQSGSGAPSPDNVRPISGRMGLNIYVSPTPNAADATTYAEDWTTPAGTVYGGTLDVVTGLLTVDWVIVDLGTLTWTKRSNTTGNMYRTSKITGMPDITTERNEGFICSAYKKTEQSQSITTIDPYSMMRYAGTIFCRNDDYDDVESFTASMSGVQLCYELATSLTYQLTGTDIVTLVGDNYIWSDSGDVTITE